MIDSKQYSLRNYQRTLEDYCDYVEIARAAGAESVLDQIIPEIYSEAMFPGTTMIYSFPSYVYSLWQEYSAEDLEHIASFCEEKVSLRQQFTGNTGLKKPKKFLKKGNTAVCVYRK